MCCLPSHQIPTKCPSLEVFRDWWASFIHVENWHTVIAIWSFPRQDLMLHRHISHHGRSMYPSSCRSHCCSRLNLRSFSDVRLRFHVAAVLLGPRWITTIKLRSTLQHEMSCWLFLCFCWNCTRFDYTRGCLLKQIVYSLFTSLMTTACNNQLDFTPVPFMTRG